MVSLWELLSGERCQFSLTGERLGRERRGKALSLGTQGAWFCSLLLVPLLGLCPPCLPCAEGRWGRGRVKFSPLWESVNGGLIPRALGTSQQWSPSHGTPQRRPWSRFVRHSFLCSCHDIRQHFETIYSDDSANGLGHLSLLPEPTSLQFQGKIWAIVNTPKRFGWF